MASDPELVPIPAGGTVDVLIVPGRITSCTGRQARAGDLVARWLRETMS